MHRSSKILSFLPIRSAAIPVILIGISLNVQAGRIPDGSDGWDLGNVNVVINPDGSYYSDVYDRAYIDGLSGEVWMATLVASNPPVGIPPGIKVLNDQVVANGEPESCIMATAVGVTCGSAYLTHKPFTVQMRPATVDDAGSDSVDLVFKADNSGDAIEQYRVFQQISNHTGERLTGFRLEVGFWVGGDFGPATANLSVEVDPYFTDPDKKTNFSRSLFGPREASDWREAGEFTGGFFDDGALAGYRIQEVNSAAFESVPDTLTDGIFGAYEDVLPEDDLSAAGMAGFEQFGPWLPSDYLPQGVFFDDDQDPDTADTLMAWWGYNPACATTPDAVVNPVNNNDHYCWMYGDSDYYAWIDDLDPPLGFVKDLAGNDNYQPVIQDTFNAWVSDPRYYVRPIDGLANLNLNYVVNVGTVDDSWPTWDPGTSTATFTVRVTPLQDANVANRTAQPGYMSAPHVPLTSTRSVGTVSILPFGEFVPGRDTLTLTVTDGDLNVDDAVAETVTAETGTVVVRNPVTLETEAVTLTETGNNTGVFTGTLATEDGPPDLNNSGTIFAVAGQTLQVTYNEAGVVLPPSDETLAIAGYDGSVVFTAAVYPGSLIPIRVVDADLTAAVITVRVENGPGVVAPDEYEYLTLSRSPIVGRHEYIGALASTGAASGNDDGILSITPGDILEVTYTDEDTAVAGVKDVLRKDQINVSAAPLTFGDGGGGACTAGNARSLNPTMPALLLAILALGWIRHRRGKTRH